MVLMFRYRMLLFFSLKLTQHYDGHKRCVVLCVVSVRGGGSGGGEGGRGEGERCVGDDGSGGDYEGLLTAAEPDTTKNGYE